MLDRGGSLGGGVGCADVDNKDFLVVAVIEAVTLADLEVAWDIVVSCGVIRIFPSSTAPASL